MYSYKLWTEQERTELKKYLGKMSYKQMLQFFPDRTASSLQCYAKSNGWKSPYIHKIHSKDESFWETPNPINCYWAGYFAADGYLYEKKGATFIKLHISILDLERLELLKNQTKFTGNIRRMMKKSPRSENVYEMCELQFSSCEKWIADMRKNFALCQGKTKILQPPNLDNDYLKLCYLIGYIDGDGTIFYDEKRDFFTIRFVSCSKEILNWIDNIIKSHFFIGVRKNRPLNVNTNFNNHSSYAISGIKGVKLFEFLRSIPISKLDRKWNNQKNLLALENHRKKFPQFWEKGEYSFDESGNLRKPTF